MNKKHDEFLVRIQATFRTEAEEHLRTFSACLIDLEKTRTKKRISEITDTMFREIHSLKGAARCVGQIDIESVCHPLESLLSAIRDQKILLSQNLFDIIYKAVNGLSKLTAGNDPVQSTADRQVQRELINRLKEAGEVPETYSSAEEPDPDTETGQVETVAPFEKETETISGNLKSPTRMSKHVVRIPVNKLDLLLMQAEEMIQTKISLDQRLNELKEIKRRIYEVKDEIQDLGKRQLLTPSVPGNELSQGKKNNLYKPEDKLSGLIRSMERDQYTLNRIVNDHLGDIKQLLMLPVSYLVESFPVMVREISREQQKEIEFIVRGAELEIDKRILEELKDPLIHLIRNSIDHGIGTPQERILHNKPPHGTIILSFIARESGIVEITVSDDGEGINTEQVLKAAIKSGYLSAEAAAKMEQGEILSLICQSGVSTSSIITNISGRGLGLSIVREKVEELNGRISMETRENSGTSFHLLVPMSLATFRSILVRNGDSLFMIPSANVERVMRVDQEEIRRVENRETIRIADSILPVADLGDVLGLEEIRHSNAQGTGYAPDIPKRIVMAVLVSGDNRVAFKVDEIIDEKQVLVKSLGKLLKRVKNISGASVLGTGKVVPVLSISDLMKSALLQEGKIKQTIADEMTSGSLKRILVADDSITARTLIKNILETAGYQVTTAVDGADAFSHARGGNFDLVLSDIDMPLMNGFELTSKIRNDKKLSELPVILVTALESREDRERGIEAGADAYIIKSSFDQANLLEVIRRLI